jgi:hypothetical protein
MMTTRLTLEDLEAMRQHYRIAQEEEQQAPPVAAGRRTDALLEDLGQVGVLEEVGMRLERWAQLRGVPMGTLSRYGTTSTRRTKRRTQKGPKQ